MRDLVLIAVLTLTAQPSLADKACKDGGEMVEIPGGTFEIGCDQETECQLGPARKVRLDAYRIDVAEVTNADYSACMRAGGCKAPVRDFPRRQDKKHRDHPVVGVSWKQAKRYCAWRGKRLPTEAEWERAARGPGLKRWPWGDGAKTCERAHTDACGDWSPPNPNTRPVCSLPNGNSPEGLCDMVGNAGEWVSDVYAPISRRARRRVTKNPRGPCRKGRRCDRRRHVMKSLPFASTPGPHPGTRWPTKRAYFFVMGLRCAAEAD